MAESFCVWCSMAGLFTLAKVVYLTYKVYYWICFIYRRQVLNLKYNVDVQTLWCVSVLVFTIANVLESI